jgi:hypothetical protein
MQGGALHPPKSYPTPNHHLRRFTGTARSDTRSGLPRPQRVREWFIMFQVNGDSSSNSFLFTPHDDAFAQDTNLTAIALVGLIKNVPSCVLLRLRRAAPPPCNRRGRVCHRGICPVPRRCLPAICFLRRRLQGARSRRTPRWNFLLR